MELSIIVVNWNTCGLLKKCLRSIHDTVCKSSLEIIVVDNGSNDGSVEFVQEYFPQVKLIDNQENLGFARANNQAIRASNGKFILLLNSDAFLTPNAVQEMIRLMNGNPEIGIVGASLFYPDGRPQLSHGPIPTLRTEIWSLAGLDKVGSRINQRRSRVSFLETGTVSGACLLVRRTLLNEIGLLDENFFMFSEEVDLCHRAHKVGWKVVYLPTARVIHVGGGSTGVTAERILMLYHGKLQYYSKHFDDRVAHRLLAVMKLITTLKVKVYLLKKMLRPECGKKAQLWREVADGLGNLKV